MNKRVLLVDDEQRVLDGFRRNLRRQFDVVTANSGQEGLAQIESAGPFAVVVSDYRMAEMHGVDFLSRVAEAAPNTVRMMLTGQADMQATIAAINDGRIFRFLTKPCPPEALAAALREGIDQYRLIEAERELLEKTLRQTVQVLIDIIGLIDADTHRHSVRISQRVSGLCDALGLERSWEYTLAATLSQLGAIALPSVVVDRFRRGEALGKADQKMMNTHPQSAHNLLVRIPRLERVAQMVLLQNEPPGTRPLNTDDPGDEDIVAIGAHLLDVSLRYEKMLAQGLTPADAVVRLRDGSGPPFRVAAVNALDELGRDTARYVHRELSLTDLEPGMLLDADLKTLAGLMLLATGTELTAAHLERASRFAAHGGVEEPIDVLVHTTD
ncbi:MAG: response regulator [Acidimicrobiia bacterium]|nr:response regulator [Acidimicrobiia bacterium]